MSVIGIYRIYLFCVNVNRLVNRVRTIPKPSTGPTIERSKWYWLWRARKTGLLRHVLENPPVDA